MHHATKHQILRRMKPPRCEIVNLPHVVDIVSVRYHDVAQVTVVVEFLHRQKLLVKPHRLSDEKLDVVLPHQIDEMLRVCQRCYHRFRADDVLARRYRGHTMFCMKMIWGIDSDDFNIVALDEFAVICRPKSYAELLCVGFQNLRAP